jgi:hypothetical protein
MCNVHLFAAKQQNSNTCVVNVCNGVCIFIHAKFTFLLQSNTCSVCVQWCVYMYKVHLFAAKQQHVYGECVQWCVYLYAKSTLLLQNSNTCVVNVCNCVNACDVHVFAAQQHMFTYVCV